ncbi:sulfotransferase family 2 domain-containing protein [Ectothiorhodospira mobilis]|uniref:sulfotransferase family 2 domain-containing protein n=1 Tax=Ectothiorhodospira mobilis TaxID=195064 RepID=UPI001EE85784|nr:sulfotransferase family 2 domain-containing protein [Ectothiorhodospira mobilis]MCG5535571.1 sulfotransferase family protein [Ectothiorhodospira mobilis]
MDRILQMEVRLSPFDHRGPSVYLRDVALNLLGKSRGLGESHYVFEASGRRVAYCYIRKNASTAFKRLIVDSSPHREALEDCGSRIRFLERYHREDRLKALAACDYRIFVYRDVLRRMASLFVNKFVLSEGAADISKDVAQRLGRPVEALSFERFVEAYLDGARNVNELDPHVWEQVSHLRPLHYTHAIPLERLEADMASILGRDRAREYFGRKVNVAGAGKGIDAADVASWDVASLRARHGLDGSLPTYAQLLRADLASCLSRIYRRDERMIRRIRQQ